MSTRYPVRFMTVVFLTAVMNLTSQAIAGQEASELSGQIRSVAFSKAVPGQLNYQGYLANATDSSAVTATLEITFRLFDSETKGAELWSETHPAVEVQGGLFQALLGSVTAFPDGLFDGSKMWLQTEVGTEVLSPRKPMVSVAYSHRTNSAEMLEDNTLTDLDQRWVGTDDLDHLDAADGTPLNAVYVDGSGRVGIGTTSPVHPLDVDGSVNATAYFGDGSNLTGVSGTADADWTINGNDVYHQTGNVGIGNTSPSYPLDVSGSVNATTYYGDGSNLTGVSGSADDDWTIAGDTVYHETGPVGIGTTSPAYPLDVSGSVNATAYYGDGSNLTGISGSTDADWTIRGDTVYHEVGPVGIGTASPTAPLTIQAVSGNEIYFPSTGWNVDIMSPLSMNFGTTSGHAIFLRTNGQNRVMVNGTGDVGIGTTSPGYKLDVNGDVNATTYYGDGSNLTGIAGSADADWTIAGNDIYSAVSGDVGIGTSSPIGKLHVLASNGNYAQLGRVSYAVNGMNPNNNNWGYFGGDYGAYGSDIGSGNYGYLGGSSYAVYGIHNSSGNSGYVGGGAYAARFIHSSSGNLGRIGSSGEGIYGKHGDTDNYGTLGAYSWGAYGNHADSANYGGLGGEAYGAYGYNSGDGNYGALGTNDYGVYYSGGIGGSAKNSLIVRTEDGPKELCSHQTTESWCEDFGRGLISGGRAEIQLMQDYLQTVTVSPAHPLRVFITPNERIGEWWVEKGASGFALVAPDAPDGARFDYRVVAKQQGYEDQRLISAPAGYGDHFLYPDIADVPLEHRARWRSSAPGSGTE